MIPTLQLGALGRRIRGTGGDPYLSFRKTIANLDVDLSDPYRTWTANGGAAVSGGKLVLDGTNDYISTPQDTALDVGANDFAFEAFVTLGTVTAAEHALFAKWAGTTSYLFGINGSGLMTFYFNQSGTGNIFRQRAGAVSTGVEHHMAWFKTGGQGYFALDGVVALSGAVGTIVAQSLPMTIGATSDPAAFLNASVRGARVTIGSSGGYGASNFTPPSFPLPLA